MKPPEIAVLTAFIENQSSKIESITKKIKSIDPSDEDKTIHLAYELHNIYSAFEDLFKEIAKTFENEVERASRFHKDLLTRMKLDIKSIRPRIISEKSYEFLLELLGFRHVFRHAYNYALSPKKVNDLKEKYLQNYPLLKEDIRNFRSFLEQIQE